MATVASAPSRNLRTALIAATIALAMLGMGFAAVPLYRLFCQVTGFAGTTQTASDREAAAASARARATGAGTISIRFDASIDRDLPWTFKPAQVTETVRVGNDRSRFSLPAITATSR